MFCKVNSFRFCVCSSVACLLYYSLGSAARRRTAAGLAALGLCAGITGGYGLIITSCWFRNPIGLFKAARGWAGGGGTLILIFSASRGGWTGGINLN